MLLYSWLKTSYPEVLLTAQNLTIFLLFQIKIMLITITSYECIYRVDAHFDLLTVDTYIHIYNQ